MMTLSFLCLSLLPLMVSPEVLRTDPDSDQFFSNEAVKLSCVESWSVKRTRTGSEVESCGFELDFGVTNGSTCFLLSIFLSESGVYWCESAAGARSPQRPLSFTDRKLILDGPALPVVAGSDITLRCRIRTGSGLSPVLVKDGAVVQNTSEWSFIVSKEHEGEYSCVQEEEESEKKKLQVTGPRETTSTLLAALGALALLGLVLVLVLVCYRRRRSQSGSDPESADVTYADVTVRKAAAAPPPREEDTVYSGVKTRPKGPEEVTYGEVTIKPNDNKKRKRRRREDPNGPWSDPEVIYSSVKTRASAGARSDSH